MKKYLAMVLTLCLLIGLLTAAIPVYAAESDTDKVSAPVAKTYRNYIEEIDASLSAEEISLSLDSKNVVLEPEKTVFTDKGILFKSEEACANLKFNAPTDGVYVIELGYIPTESGNFTSSTIGIKINGEYPFDEAKELSLSWRWKGGKVTTDSKGNEIVGSMSCIYEETVNPITDPSGRQIEPLLFHISEGENILSIIGRTPNFTLCSVRLINRKTVPTYDEVKAKYPTGEVTGQNILLEAEKYTEATSTTLSPEYDKGSSLTSPNDARVLLYNYIPGTKYTTPGQAITWEFTPEVSGLYNISMRARQNTKSGFSVSRKLFINGEVPFSECNDLKFDYKGNWDVTTLGGDEPYCFYFEAGKTYTLRLEATIGSLCEVTNRVDDLVYELNSFYRGIMMVVGNDSDKYRDYQLGAVIPNFFETVEKLETELKNIVEELSLINAGKSGSSLTSFHSLINRFGKIKKDPDLAARALSSIKSDIQGLSAWNQNAKAQPLDLDYIRIHTPDVHKGKGEANFFSQLWFTVKRIALSFTEDYGVVGDIYDKDSSIEVWMGTGRDQMNILKKLVDNSFVQETGIYANISLVTVDIRSAILAGTAPDLSLFLSGDMPVNLALRDAVVDLTEFDTYEKVSERFLEHSITPFRYKNGVYALPISESFNMMFVRTDIFEELELSIPNTWEEFYEASTILQRNNLEVGIPSNIGMYATLVLQNGGTFYNEDLSRTAFDTESAIEAFKTWTGLFARYGFPLAYDFYNRFSAGEMPMAIASYTEYLRIKVASPELSGRWQMCLIPGVLKEDGTIDRSLSISTATGGDTSPGLAQAITSAAIFSKSEKKAEAWKFIDWFTSDEIQSRFGREIEDNLGQISRYTSANLNAFKSLPWSIDERTLLVEQRQWIKSLNEISGNYSVTRELISAFRKVLYDNANPTETIYTYNKKINKELERKN